MGTSLAFLCAAVLYLVATASYLGFLARGGRRLERWGTCSLAASLLVHAGFVVTSALSSQGMLEGIRLALAWLSLLIPLAYLVSMRKHRLPVLGAIVTPLSLLLFLGAGLPGQAHHVPSQMRSLLLPVHIGVNVLGMAAFALAFAAAIAYVLQEELLRRKRVGRLLHALPPLDVLDSLGLRLVTIGFTLFTVGVVTGSVWATRRNTAGSLLSAGQGLAILAWLFFGSVLLARAAAGWRGRRAAIGTVLGFLCSLAALGGYVLRDVGGS